MLYICFRVPPYSHNISRSLIKESKYYLFDWLPIKDRGALLENIVAVHLQKACHYWTDLVHDIFELCYIRTREKQEIDFCVVREGVPMISATSDALKVTFQNCGIAT
jgi:predicted AAA+ superfamily ATPase